MFVINITRQAYDQTWDLQHRLVRARRVGIVPDTLILVEHEPVITLGRRGDESHIVGSAEMLAARNVIVRRIERGGDVTFHGPGQLVGYPIIDLRDHRAGVSWYMHTLEDVIIGVLADWGITAYCQKGVIGVWVDDAKIAALGVRIEKRVTYHGFALNVNTDLSYFDLIVPCGLDNRAVTSMERILGHRVDMNEIRTQVARYLAGKFVAVVEEITLAELLEMLPKE